MAVSGERYGSQRATSREGGEGGGGAILGDDLSRGMMRVLIRSQTAGTQRGRRYAG